MAGMDSVANGRVQLIARSVHQLQEIEGFLKSRNLIAEVAEQRSEAKWFIDLMTVEAGLLVERGTDGNGEALYSFVHRTFQEYFAAADVHERFQQAVDLTLCVTSWWSISMIRIGAR